jgi:hypothetical protein
MLILKIKKKYFNIFLNKKNTIYYNIKHSKYYLMVTIAVINRWWRKLSIHNNLKSWCLLFLLIKKFILKNRRKRYRE